VAITREGTSALVNTGTGSTAVLTYPTVSGGILADDLAVIVIAISSTTKPSLAGWTQQAPADANGVSPSTVILTKFMTGGESGTVSVTTATQNRKAMMLIYRGVDTTTPVVDSDTFESSTAVTAYSVPALTGLPSGSAIIGIAAGNANAGSITEPTAGGTWTEIFDNTNSVVPNAEAAEIIGVSGSVGPLNWVRSGAIRGCVSAIALQPAATSIPATVNGEIGVATAEAPIPGVTAASTVAAETGTATSDAQIPAVTARSTVAAAIAQATALAPIPDLRAAATVVAVAATVTALAIAPAPTARATVAAPTATATSAAPVHSVSAAATVGGVTATASGELLIPTVTTGGGTVPATVTPPASTATGTALPASVSGRAAITAPASAATAQALAPTVTARATVAVTLAASTALALPPTIGARANVVTPIALATSVVVAPTVKAAARVVAPTGTVTAVALAPVVGQEIVPTESAPASRTYDIKRGSRVYDVPARPVASTVNESRIYDVPARNTTYTVPADSRTYDIGV
jgi:hypothetical protein